MKINVKDHKSHEIYSNVSEAVACAGNTSQHVMHRKLKYVRPCALVHLYVCKSICATEVACNEALIGLKNCKRVYR